MRVITVSGKAGSGKDLFAGFLQQHLATKDQSVFITHYADFLKYILKQYYGWNGNKDAEGRHLLQFVGTQVFRKYDKNFWVDLLMNVFQAMGTPWDFVIIPDARFRNEITRMQEKFDVLSIRIERDFHSTLDDSAAAHQSETELDDFDFDLVVRNETIVGLDMDAYRVSNLLTK